MAANWDKVLEKVSSKSAPEAEADLLKEWEKNDTLRKSIDNRPESKGYTFYDGPITANNKPHYGHALTMVIKDAVPRYWTMRGYRVDRSLGWDCQGIPVEYEVEKALKFESKADIEKYGVAKFNQLCRESVEAYQKDIFALTARMGRWVNKDEEFATMDREYIESVWWSLKELYQKDLLYQGYKVVPYSTRAGSTLSNSEVALGGYKEIVDPAVTIKLKLKGEDKYVLTWTTTPWTLPGNLLLAVLEGEDYVDVEHKGVTYVVAKELAETVFGEEEYKVLAQYKGKELVGKEYEPLFTHYKDRAKQGAFKVVHAEHVTVEEGTGIVHQAPYGEDDFFLLTGMGIELFDYLDDTGTFTDEIKEFSGMFYKKANKYIMEDLKKRDLLFKHEDYTHRMPMCWRTDTPLIYKPVKSWYVKVTQIAKDMLKENSEILWMPGHIRDGRFGNWLEGARDWALSRKRYWGTPLPVWICDKCEEVEVLGSFEEVEEKSGVMLDDPHKPFVDDVKYKCDCGGEKSRVEDVIDVWYDSGAMPFARFHYPFENKDLFDKKFPAQFIAEGIDQTRGWFYTLHVLGTALFGSKAFENVIVNGMALAGDGQKMSKSKKNYTEPDAVLDKFGADPVRLYFLSSPIVRAEDVAFDEKFLKEINSSTLIPLWNSFKYFLNYAKQFDWDKRGGKSESDHVMDRWVLTRLQKTVNETGGYMDQYDLQKASKTAMAFVDELSRWYIRGSRDRFVSGDDGALSTLYYVMETTSKMFAPLIPFMSERIYQGLTDGLKGAQESVHLTDYPEVVGLSKEDGKLLDDMTLLREVVSLGHNVRVENSVKVKQPLSSVYLEGVNLSKEYTDLLLKELNVKKVEAVDKVKASKTLLTSENKGVVVGLELKLSKELKDEGLLNELIRHLQVLRKEGGFKLGEPVEVHYSSEDKDVLALVDTYADEIKRLVIAKELVESKASEGKELKLGDKKIEVELK